MKEFIKMYKENRFRYSDWLYTGFLSALSSEQEPQVIELFEKGMQYVLKNDIDDKRNQLILPIIRRVYTSLFDSKSMHNFVDAKNKLLLYNIIDIDDLIKDFYLLYENIMPYFLLNFKYIDIEAEFCLLFTNNYIGKLSKEFFENRSGKDILLILTRDNKLKSIIG